MVINGIIDLDNGELLEATGKHRISALDIQGSETAELKLTFYKNGSAVTDNTVVNGAVIDFGVKADADYTGTSYLIYHDTFSASTDGLEYSGTPTWATAEVETALGNESSVKLHGQVKVVISGVTYYSQVFEVEIHNNVIQAAGTTNSVIYPRLIQSTSDPTVNDDSLDGYGVSSLWLNTSSNAVHVLMDNTAGAAVWAGFLGLTNGQLANNLVFNDDLKAVFGTSSDGLEIYHNGSSSYIDDTGTGDLILRANDQLKIQGYSNSHNMAVYNKAGSVDLYYNNSKKFETTDTGATVSGKLIVSGDLDVDGVTTSFDSTVVNVADPVFGIGGSTPPGSQDNKDRGVSFRYHDGASAKVGFYGWDNSEDSFVFLTDTNDDSTEVFSGTLADLKASKTLLEDGSASAPSYSFSSNTDTGIFGSHDALSFSVNGSRKAYISTAGVTSDANVYHSATGSFRGFGYNAVISTNSGYEIVFKPNDTEAARFDSSGNLKLLNNLTISSTYPRIFLTDTNNNSDYSIINDDGTFSIYDDTNASHLMRLNSTGLGIGCTPTARLEITTASQGDTALQVGYTNSLPNLLVGTTTGSTKLEIANNNYHHKFYTRNASGTAVERLTIEGGSDTGDIKIINSNLGIGGTANRKLTVFDTNYRLASFERTSGTNGYIVFKDQNTTQDVGIGATTNDLKFRSGNVDHMVLDSSGVLTVNGNVGCSALTAGTGIELHTSGTNNFLSSQESANNFTIRNTATNKDIIFQVSDGSLNELLRLDGSTSSINIPNDIQLRIGGANDIRIVSESSVNRFNFYNHNTDFRSLTDNTDITFKTTTGGTTSEILRLDASASSINVPDNVNLIFGGDSDLKIYHSSTSNESFVQNVTGNFNLNNTSNGDDLILRQSNSSGTLENYIQLDGGGRLTRSYRNFRVQDGIKLQAGSSGLLDIYSDGTNSYIDEAGTGDLYIRSNNLRLANADGSGQFINANNGGNVELFYNGSKKIETLNTGCKITGILNTDTVNNAANSANIIYRSGTNTIVGNHANALVIQDSAKVGIGTTAPLDLVHIKSSSNDARILLDGHTNFDAELKFAENGTVKYTIGNDAATDNFVIGTANVDNPLVNIEPDGDVEIKTDGKGLILNSPDGTAYKITVANDGTVTSTAV
jgi:hypothetical protein